MIYLVTRNQELFDNDVYKIISVDESLHLLSSLDKIGIDSETNGLSAWDNDLLLFQFGCKEFQVVVDCRTIDICEYKELLESDKKFIGWNLKFDLQFLYKHNIICTNIYDGMIVEKLLFLGYPSNIHPLSLKHAGYKYLNIELDKSVRGKIIWSKTLTDDIIVYSAEDVAHLEDICNKQIECLKEKDLIIAAKVENAFIPSLAYTEWCGIKLDKDKWKVKMNKDKERLDKATTVLEEWFLKNEPNSPYIVVDLQGDLFAENPYNLTPKVTINWNSAKQMIPIFKKYGVDVTIEDKDKGGTKDSIDVKTLKPQADKCDLILPYIEYKEAVKVVSTYGDKFLRQINSKTGRIKSKFNQLGADTSRLSSGGKDGDVEYINFQNLPADAETRSCFTCEEGNVFLSIDFCGEESFLMASIANDKAMINELTYGEKDLHTLTAKIVFSQIPKDMSAKEVKEKYHKERSLAKGYEFAFNYAGTADTIKRNFGLTDEEASRIYNAYMNGFSGLKRYQENQKKYWFNHGYILLNQITKHKAFIYDYEELMADKEWMSSLDWDYYRQMKNENPECDTVQRVRHYFKRKVASDKQSVNYLIQGTGAVIFKIALAKFFKWIIEHNLFNKVKICILVHDEICAEAPKEISEEVATALYNCMVETGAIFCTRCKLDAEMSRLKDGSLPLYWIH